MTYLRKLLREIGLEEERLAIYFLSSAEGGRFAEIATEMTERIRQLGPSPLRTPAHPPVPQDKVEALAQG